jgi:hypothetical protein
LSQWIMTEMLGNKKEVSYDNTEETNSKEG